MENELNNAKAVRAFLLGNLSEAERTELEDGFLAQDDFYQELLIAEDELIDAYVRGELPAPERAVFEQRRLTSPHLRERVEFAQTLFNSLSDKAVVVPARADDDSISWWQSLAAALAMRRPALGFGVAAALLVILLGGLWFLTEKLRTPAPEQAKIIQPPPVIPRESPTPGGTPEPQQLAGDEVTPIRTPVTETPERTAPVLATFTLTPGLVRGAGGAEPLVLRAVVTDVRLRLTLDSEPYEKYRATISTPEGTRVWSGELSNGSSKKSSLLNLSLPANLFKNGDYVLDLSGANAPGKWESVADYSFRIVKK